MNYMSFSYSLDKIKFTGRIKTPPRKFGQAFFNHVATWANLKLPHGYKLISEGESLKPFRYRFWYDIRSETDKEGVFHIEECYNGDYQSGKPIPNAFQIEYNPNKSGQAVYESFCQYFAFTVNEIKSFDIAYDLPGADVRSVYLDTKADIMKYGKTARQTLYISPKSDSGRVKVYQKDKERAEHGKELEKTLRIECSIRPGFTTKMPQTYCDRDYDIYGTAVEHLNAVKIRSDTAIDTDDWKLYALSRLPPEELEKALSMMSINSRSKYKAALFASGITSLGLDVPMLSVHCMNLLSPYIERMKI